MPAIAPDFDAHFFRSALGRFATGVTVITTETKADAAPVGLTISSFNSVSLEPPLVLWTLSRTATSLHHFEQCDRYVVHVLAATQLHLAKRFAYGAQSSRFQGLDLKRSPSGTLMLDEDECAAWFECYNLTRHEAGDHLIFIGQVERCHRNFSQPLVYHAGDFDLTPSTEPLSSN
jgi:flavin reductase (DIM6/NTAB) family NADH-FMN oxidoreductase RutF